LTRSGNYNSDIFWSSQRYFLTTLTLQASTSFLQFGQFSPSRSHAFMTIITAVESHLFKLPSLIKHQILVVA